jgi:hypothetical protein
MSELKIAVAGRADSISPHFEIDFDGTFLSCAHTRAAA